MKNLYILLWILLTAYNTKAQFSNSPAQPLSVCNSTATKENLQILPDGSGGYFTFWIDNRTGTIKKLYGQHLDAAGNEQWTANGKTIIQHPTQSVNAFHCTLFNNGILFTWVQSGASYQDSLLVKKVNFSGNDVWAQPTLIDKSSQAASILGIETYSMNVIANDSGAFVNYSVVYYGGSSGPKFNRIDFNGVKQWSTSKTTSLPGYTYLYYKGPQNTFFSISRGNGLGSGMYIQKYNLQSIPQWANAADISQGVNTNGFGGLQYLFSDNAGNSYIVWESMSNKTLLTKLDAAGSFVWTPQFKATVGLANTGQNRPHATFYNNKLYIVWMDNRVANQTTVYAQAYNSSGATQWLTDGVELGENNYYYSYPKIAVSDSNAVLVAYNNPSLQSIVGHRIKSNGTLAWPLSGIDLATDHSWISYNSITAINDTNGCNAIFWNESSTSHIWGAKICSNGVLVNTIDNSKPDFEISPNPASDNLNIKLGSILNSTAISIIDMNGKIIMEMNIPEPINELNLDLKGLAKGIYALSITSKDIRQTKKLIIK